MGSLFCRGIRDEAHTTCCELAGTQTDACRPYLPALTPTHPGDRPPIGGSGMWQAAECRLGSRPPGESYSSRLPGVLDGPLLGSSADHARMAPLDLSDDDIGVLAVACRAAAHVANGRLLRDRRTKGAGVSPEQFVPLAERLEAV
jgi:hypothetical protein